jgi:multiple sugar transport system permease protein
MSRTTPRRRLRPASLIFHAVAIPVAVAFLLPLLLVATTSLRPLGLPPARTLELLPPTPDPGNYARLFQLLPFGRYALNSLVVVAVAVPLTLLTASLAGFGMALLGARSRRLLTLASVAMLMIPVTALWLTRYLLFTAAGLIDTFAALVLPAAAGSSPLFVLLYHWTFRRVPREVYESARLDGAGTLTTWRLVALPLARPTTVAVAVLAFLFYWSDFISPLLYLKSQERYTLPLGLQQLQQLDRSAWPLLMAASVLLALPAVVAFLVAQRRLLGGTLLGPGAGTDGR